MVNLHDLGAETVDFEDSRVIVKSWCHCGRLIIAAGPSENLARRSLWRTVEAHRGHENAAGPGGVAWLR